MIVPTPSVPLVDASAIIGGAFDFMPVVTGALALFVVIALGWRYGGRVLSWVLRFGSDSLGYEGDNVGDIMAATARIGRRIRKGRRHRAHGKMIRAEDGHSSGWLDIPSRDYGSLGHGVGGHPRGRSRHRSDFK